MAPRGWRRRWSSCPIPCASLSRRDPLVWLEEERPDLSVGTPEALLFAGRASREDPLTRAVRAHARTAQEEEYRRLLYVAMTRAEDRLYVCGWQGRDTPPEDCWYALVRAGLESLTGVETLAVPDGAMPEGTGLVYAELQTAPLPPRAEPGAGGRCGCRRYRRSCLIPPAARAPGTPCARALPCFGGACAAFADRRNGEPRPPARHCRTQAARASAGVGSGRPAHRCASPARAL